MPKKKRKDSETDKIIFVGQRMFPFGSTGWGWDPLLGLRSISMTMNTLCRELFPRSSSFFDEEPVEPPINLYKEKNFLIIEISLPGADKDDILIHATSNLLIIEGEIAEEQIMDDSKYFVRERQSGRFMRSIPLPCPILPNEIRSEFKEGVIKLIFPVKEA